MRRKHVPWIIGLLVLMLPACLCPASGPSISGALATASAAARTLLAATQTPVVAPASPVVITSDDGQAQLVIPQSAVPPGIDLSKVHILRTSPNVPAATSQAGDTLAAYQLEPDGLVWQQPITFTTIVTGQLAAAPNLWLLSNGALTALTDIQETYDPTANQSVISTQISHFSEVIFDLGFIEVTVSAPDLVPVGQTFTVTAIMRANHEPAHFLTKIGPDGTKQLVVTQPLTVGQPALITYVDFPSNQFTAENGAFAVARGPLTPTGYDSAPKQQIAGPPDPTVSVSRSFTCEQAGAAILVYIAYLKYTEVRQSYIMPIGAGPDVNVSDLTPSGPPQQVSQKLWVPARVTVNCGAESLTWTPTPTRTPNATDLASRALLTQNAATWTKTPTSTITPTGTSTGTPTPTPTPKNLPVVSLFTARFVAAIDSTVYTVTASDPAGGKLKYAWTKVQPAGKACGSLDPTNEAKTVWEHWYAPIGNCPKEPVHAATIIVVVSNAAGSVTCEYVDGSASGTAAQCVNSK